MPDAIGQPELRIDGRQKVTGDARYPSDESFANAAYAFLVTSPIARGQVADFQLADVRAIPGVVDILTSENLGGQATPPPPGGQGGATTATLESDRVWHDGQIVAVVVAETYETAREGAYRLRATYAAEPAAAGFDAPGAEPEDPHKEGPPMPAVGDAEAALAAAPVKVDQHYSTPTQHHNPMVFATTCAWEGGRLVIQEASQFVHGLRGALATQLAMDPKDIRVLSKFVGGAFGSRGGATARTAWIAVAARRLGRPVKLVATREQGFTIVTYRAETRHRVALGAGRDGKLTAVIHEGQEVTSRPSTYNVSGNRTTAVLYASPNVATKVEVVHVDRATPGFMRAPAETPYVFPFELAMDELAVALAMDPVALRKANDTHVDPVKGRPFTSRSLVQCLDAASEAFGWRRRTPQPMSMREGDWQVGWGMASAVYPANIGAAAARLTLSPEGEARVELGALDLGTGSYTIIAQVAADRLGLAIGKVSVSIGDSDLPPAGLAAGSTHGASISNVVAKACESVRERLAQAAAAAQGAPLAGLDPAALRLEGGALVGPGGRREPLAQALARVASGPLEVYAENVPDGAPADGVKLVDAGQMASARGSDLPDRLAYAFGAQFVEVRVHALTREIRVPRAVGAFAAGTILNPVTAQSQLMGGMIWGISAALLEETEIDRRSARYVNKSYADYLVPTNADIGEVKVILIPEDDHRCNPLGVKGVGELGIVGMNAALANAVWHATGKRIRDLPIRIEKLL